MWQAAECVAKHVEQMQSPTTTGPQLSENQYHVDCVVWLVMLDIKQNNVTFWMTHTTEKMMKLLHTRTREIQAKLFLEGPGVQRGNLKELISQPKELERRTKKNLFRKREEENELVTFLFKQMKYKINLNE